MLTASELLEQINVYIRNLGFSRSPEELYEPVSYVLSMGGKRLRPVLMMLAYNLYKENVSDIYAPAAGIEMYHNYTLLHDDLMDRADYRRGKVTVHKKWNDNTAILSGDAMLVLAYQLMSECDVRLLKEVMDLFSKTALEICEGQQMDMNFETRTDVTEQEYLEMIRLKTAVLLAASLKIGALLGGASASDADNLYEFGINAGLAFQLKDDLLDVYGNPAVFGKKIGGDIVCNKKTYLLIKAFEFANAEQKAALEAWITASTFVPEEKIAAVTDLYDKVGVRSLCEDLIEAYSTKAMDKLKLVQVADEKKKELSNVVAKLMRREA